ncbi:hypothetical protein J6590_009946 [Homalodisca vitripennis]|nr:hypothetical protein J6590_009946 [Homalodisca vitripennis]
MSLPSTSFLSDSEVIAELQNDNDSSSDEDMQSDCDEVLPTLENITDSDSDNSLDLGPTANSGGGDDGLDNSWSVYQGPDFPNFPYTLLGGYKEPNVNKPVSISDFFHLMFTIKLLNDIIAETNRYAQVKINKLRPLKARSIWNTWKNVSLEEIKAFFKESP